MFVLFFSVGYGIVLPFAFGVCSLVSETGPGACVGILVGGTGDWPLVGEIWPCSSVRQRYVYRCL